MCKGHKIFLSRFLIKQTIQHIIFVIKFCELYLIKKKNSSQEKKTNRLKRQELLNVKEYQKKEKIILKKEKNRNTQLKKK